MDKAKIQSGRWATLLIMGIAIMIVGMQSTMINVGLPALQVDFSADMLAAQWFLNSYILAFAGLLLLMGALGDKFGRKLFFNLGLLAFGTGSLWAVVATSTDEFMATQVLMGVGAAMLAPQTLSILVSVFKKRERALAIAIWTGLAAMGVGLGSLVGGVLLEHYGVSSLFYSSALLVMFLLISAWFIVPESKKSQSSKIDFLGALLSAVAIVALIVGFIWVPEHGWVGLYTLGAFLSALVAGLMFVKYETMIKDPILDMKYFKNRYFVDGILGVGVLSFSLLGLIFLVTQFLQTIGQKNALDTGLLLLPMATVLAVASIAGHKLATKLGNTRLIICGAAISAAGLLLVSLWQVASPDWTIVVVLSIFALGVGLALAPATNNIMKSFDEKDAGMGSAVNVLVRQMFGVIGIAVMGSVLGSKYADNLESYVVGAPIDVANQIVGSIHGAYELAADFTAQGQQAISSSVVATVNSAFMVGLAAAMAVSVIVVLVVIVSINRNTSEN